MLRPQEPPAGDPIIFWQRPWKWYRVFPSETESEDLPFGSLEEPVPVHILCQDGRLWIECLPPADLYENYRSLTAPLRSWFYPLVWSANNYQDAYTSDGDSRKLWLFRSRHLSTAPMVTDSRPSR